MMFPSLRGGNDNPSPKEGFLGEADDVIAAAEFLCKQENVDANRIYLGGHSTGGTMALIVSECSDRFRAVVAFGPVDDVSGYGKQFLPCDINDKKEIELRSPGFWLDCIRSPTFVFEGMGPGNMIDLIRNCLFWIFFLDRPPITRSEFNLLSILKRLMSTKKNLNCI